MRLLALAALCLLAMPAVALAQPIELTGTDTVRLWWEPASGPVVAYEARLLYLDGTESTPSIVGLPPQQFVPRKGIAFRLAVRACSEGPVCNGLWSEPSREVKLCPIPSDVDCNLGVGVSDFTLLVNSWGESVDE